MDGVITLRSLKVRGLALGGSHLQVRSCPEYRAIKISRIIPTAVTLQRSY